MQQLTFNTLGKHDICPNVWFGKLKRSQSYETGCGTDHWYTRSEQKESRAGEFHWNPCNGSPSIRWVNMTFAPMCGLANSNVPNPMKLDVEMTIDTQEVSKKNQEQVNSIENPCNGSPSICWVDWNPCNGSPLIHWVKINGPDPPVYHHRYRQAILNASAFQAVLLTARLGTKQVCATRQADGSTWFILGEELCRCAMEDYSKQYNFGAITATILFIKDGRCKREK